MKVLHIVKVTQQVSGKANVQKPGTPVSRCFSISALSTRAGIHPKLLHLLDMNPSNPGKPIPTKGGLQVLLPAGVINETY